MRTDISGSSAGIDDVLKVSGYRLGSAEIESALVSHPAVTEAAAIGLPDQLRGNTIHASVILATGISGSDNWWQS